jgi:hypothetical protein
MSRLRLLVALLAVLIGCLSAPQVVHADLCTYDTQIPASVEAQGSLPDPSAIAQLGNHRGAIAGRSVVVAGPSTTPVALSVATNT